MKEKAECKLVYKFKIEPFLLYYHTKNNVTGIIICMLTDINCLHFSIDTIYTLHIVLVQDTMLLPPIIRSGKRKHNVGASQITVSN